MDDELAEQVRREATVNALANAIKHEGEAQPDAILGPLLAENPKFRDHPETVRELVKEVVENVNELDAATREARFESFETADRPDITEDDTDERDLPPLPNADNYDEIRLRIAPNPNSPLHLGHARMAVVVDSYRDRYNGWLLCRYDDTDTTRKPPDPAAYDRIQQDLNYLGCEPDTVVRASARLETYEEYALNLIEAGGAYTCSCPASEFSDLRKDGRACPHREKDRETVLAEFEGMRADEYEPTEMVLRVRSSLEDDNPALRDWVAFRIAEKAHPMTDHDCRCWPTLDFQSGIDDHLTDVTHILRGTDLQTSTGRQQYLYDHFGWNYPEVRHWGKVQPAEYDVPCSASTIKEYIHRGELDGWDDPRAPTIAALERRGIRGNAIREGMLELGLSATDIEFSMSIITSVNNTLIDDDATRAFCVRDEKSHGGIIEKAIRDGPAEAARPKHPNHPERGKRTITVGETVLVEGDSLPRNGEICYLMGYGRVKHTEDGFEYLGQSPQSDGEGYVSQTIHWVPAESPTLQLRTPTGDITGRVEPNVTALKEGSLVQFERVGYARIDAQEEERTVAYLTG